LLNCYEIQDPDCHHYKLNALVDSAERARQKVNFLRAYLELKAIDCGADQDVIRKLTKYQSMKYARKGFGLWFWQSDSMLFGAGVSTFYQDHSASLFCEKLSDIDFADVCGILPFDNLVIRNPDGEAWLPKDVTAAARHIRSDLAADGFDTKVEGSVAGELADLSLISPDYGITGDETSAARTVQFLRLTGHRERASPENTEDDDE
jgi:hypothetical protein